MTYIIYCMINANIRARRTFFIQMYTLKMIVLVLGLPGSGKSYFASRLAERLGAVYINSDRTRKSVRSGRRYTPRGKSRVYWRMKELAGGALDEGKPVVADATFFRKALRDLFRALGREHDVPVRTLQVTARENLIKERLSRPREDSEADYNVYRIVRSQFEQLQADEPHLTLESGCNNIEDMLKEALDYIGGAA